MWAQVAVILGLWTGVAEATPPETMDWSTSASSMETVADPNEAPNPVETVRSQIEKQKQETERRRQERLEALDALNKGKEARVVVLKVKETDYTNETLHRNVKGRIARPDAIFYPEIDLYQQGRQEPDSTLRPIEQRAVVPEDTFGLIDQAVASVERIPWNQYSETEWGLKAQELRTLADELWFMDRTEVREPLFKLYAQVGRAAENMNNTSPPFYEQVGNQPVNYYYYLAATMAFQDPALLSTIQNEETNDSIAYYTKQLEEGGFPMMTLSFELNGEWDTKEFASEYIAYVNGIETLIDDKNGLLRVPPGRADIYLARNDGHSLSERIDLDKLNNKVYFVRDVARKKMGLDFVNQLMEHPNECTPDLDGDILDYLNIYARLHEQADIYIAVPVVGNPNKVYLWRFKRETGTLQRVLDETGGFPVRFVALLGTGVTASGGSFSFAPTVDPTQPGKIDLPKTSDVKLNLPGLPFQYELRGHFSRLVVLTGMQFQLNITDPGVWEDAYQADDNTVVANLSSVGEVTKKRAFNRLIYLGIGAVLGKQAAQGFGPRGYVRTGWTNVPHTIDASLHIGYAAQLPFNSATGRVRPMLDVDVFGGAMIPFKNTFLREIAAIPHFGFIGSVGITF